MTTGNFAVLVGKENQSKAMEMIHPYGRILVALDGSALGEQVLAYVEPLARAFGSEVICLCAVEPINSMALAGTSMPGGELAAGLLLNTQDEIKAIDATYLAGIQERLARHGIAVECEEPQGRAAEAIVVAARQRQVDLIAMTTHGRSGLGRSILGSVADEVVRFAPCPVLLVRLSAR